MLFDGITNTLPFPFLATPIEILIFLPAIWKWPKFLPLIFGRAISMQWIDVYCLVPGIYTWDWNYFLDAKASLSNKILWFSNQTLMKYRVSFWMFFMPWLLNRGKICSEARCVCPHAEVTLLSGTLKGAVATQQHLLLKSQSEAELSAVAGQNTAGQTACSFFTIYFFQQVSSPVWFINWATWALS